MRLTEYEIKSSSNSFKQKFQAKSWYFTFFDRKFLIIFFGGNKWYLRNASCLNLDIHMEYCSPRRSFPIQENTLKAEFGDHN